MFYAVNVDNLHEVDADITLNILTGPYLSSNLYTYLIFLECFFNNYNVVAICFRIC